MCNCEHKTALGNFLSNQGGKYGDRLFNKGKQQVKRLRNWAGLGDYKIVRNNLIEGNEAIAATSSGDTIVTYREYLGEITTNAVTVGAFNITTYNVNPGSIFTFPWLSALALNYDQWVPEGIIFEFKSTVSDQTSGGALGSILFASDYDMVQPAYTTKGQMLNSAYSSEAKMSDDMLHGLECDPEQNDRDVFYTRQEGVAVSLGSDIRDYDLCHTSIATNGGTLPQSTIVGSLYIHYSVRLRKEKINAGIQAYDVYFAEYTMPTAAIAATAIIASYATFALSNGKNLGMTFTNVLSGSTGTGVFVIPKRFAGYSFMVTLIYGQNSPYSPGANPLTGFSTGTGVAQFYNANFGTSVQGGNSFYGVETSYSNGADSQFTILCNFFITLAPQSAVDFTFAWTTGQFYPPAGGTVNNCDVRVRYLIIPSTFFNKQ